MIHYQLALIIEIEPPVHKPYIALLPSTPDQNIHSVSVLSIHPCIHAFISCTQLPIIVRQMANVNAPTILNFLTLPPDVIARSAVAKQSPHPEMGTEAYSPFASKPLFRLFDHYMLKQFNKG